MPLSVQVVGNSQARATAAQPLSLADLFVPAASTVLQGRTVTRRRLPADLTQRRPAPLAGRGLLPDPLLGAGWLLMKQNGRGSGGVEGLDPRAGVFVRIKHVLPADAHADGAMPAIDAARRHASETLAATT